MNREDKILRVSVLAHISEFEDGTVWNRIEQEKNRLEQEKDKKSAEEADKNDNH